MKAFPRPNTLYSDEAGMDLRDYFAAKAMQSIIIFEEGEFNLPRLAKESYRMADVMMEARK